jgi:hypothetical protein
MTFQENAILENPMHSTCPTPSFITSELYLAQKQIYETLQHALLSCILLFPIFRSQKFLRHSILHFPNSFFIWRINKVYVYATYCSYFYWLLLKIITMEQSIHLFNNSPQNVCIVYLLCLFQLCSQKHSSCHVSFPFCLTNVELISLNNVQCVYLFLLFINENSLKLFWLFYATNIWVSQFDICFLK